MAYASRTYAGAGGGATTFALTNTDGNAIGYIRESDIKVTVGTTVFTNAASGTNTYQFSGTSTLEQPSGGNIVLNASTTAAVTLERTTGIQTATVTYTAGSTLTSSDLNNADNQIRFGLQEFSDIYDPFRTGTGDLAALDGIIGGSETWTSSDAFVATTSAIDTRVGTTIDTALTTDVSGGDGVTIVDNSPGAGQIRIDLDADIATLRNMQTGAATALAALTSTEIEILDGASLSTAELNFVDGVTSAIQTQLNGKQPLATDLTNLSSMQSGASTELATLTSAELDILDGLTASTTELNLLDGVPGTLTTTEIGFLDGVTSAIQTQLDGKQTTNARLTAIGALDANDSNIIVGNGTTWVAENGATARTSLGAQAAAADLTNLSSMQSGASAALALLTSAELEILDGATPSTTELNFVDGVTSAIQGQFDGKQPLDAELTTLAGMQSGTASILAGGTALGATLSEINSICENRAAQTTITDSDAHIPTSGAVVDHVTGAVTAVGGFIAIAGPTNFDSTQPAQGVVVSVGDVGSGFTVSSQEITITNGAGSGNNVRITGFPTSLNGTIADDVGLQVTSDKNNSTSGSPNVHRYVYHKILAKETDVIQLSDDINDFNERYRTDATGNNPTSNNHAGDLFFNQGTDTMLVRNAANNAWQEVQSSGDFYINTFASLGASGDTVPGGSATPNGTAQKFTLSNAGSVTQQHLVSVNGVVQQPSSSGSVSSAPSNGFVVDGSALVLASAPPSGATLFVVTIGASVNIGAPSNNTVGNNQLQNGAVDNAKVSANAAIDYSKLAALTDGNILVGNGSNVATSVNPSGDIDISNAGVFSIASGVIVNADVNASAAIAGSKIAPDFGSQNIVTTGALTHNGDTTFTSGSRHKFIGGGSGNNLELGTYSSSNSSRDVHLQIDSAGNLGINEASPGHKLVVGGDAYIGFTTPSNAARQLLFNTNRGSAGDTLANINWQWNSKNVAQIRGIAGSDTTNKDNGHLAFFTSSANALVEAVRIDSARRLIIGHNTSTGQDRALQIIGTTTDTASVELIKHSADASAGSLSITKSRNATKGSNTIVQADDTLGSIVFRADDGTDLTSAGASIVSKIDGTPGANDTPGRLEFRTTPDGSNNPAERMRIDESGNVGIATTSPGEKLDVSGNIRVKSSGVYKAGHNGSAGAPLYSVGDADTGMYRGANANELAFSTAGTQRALIDASGQVLIGTTSSTTLASAAPLQIEGSAASTGLSILRTASAGGQIQFGAGSSGDDVTNNDGLGHLKFFGYHTNGYDEYARISAAVDGTPGDGDAPGALIFYTTADGASSVTERMRIDPSGNVGIGTVSPSQKFHVKGLCQFETTNSSNHWINYAHTDNSYRMNYNGSGNDEIVFPSGGGVNFSGGTAAVDTLDDYEEGTWTPQLTGGTSGTASGGTTGQGWDTAIGVYTKTGNTVHWNVHLSNTHVSDISGDLRISLPFTADGGQYSGGVNVKYTGACAMNGVNYTAVGQASSCVDEGQAYARISETIDDSGLDYINAANINNDSDDIFMSGFYFVQ